VDFAPDSDAGMESMLGFRQDLGFSGSVQSVAAVSIQPEVESFGSDGSLGADGVDEAAVRTWETLQLGDELEAVAGSTQVVARSGGNVSNTVATALPFVTAGWRSGDSTYSYRLTTSVPTDADVQETEARNWMPQLSARDGRLAMEHGLHQEIRWERRTDASGVSVAFFADRIDSPVIAARGNSSNDRKSIAGALMDQASGMMRMAGMNFSSTGILATVQRQLPGGNQIRVSYGTGDALVMATPATGSETAGPQSTDMARTVVAAHPHRTQMYSLSLSGTLEGTGTRWRASYRWQPEDSVTRVAQFAENAAPPYVNLRICQPIHLRRSDAGGAGSTGFEAILDVRNLLAQGYLPYLTTDGSLLVFAQDQRALSGGVAFTF